MRHQTSIVLIIVITFCVIHIAQTDEASEKSIKSATKDHYPLSWTEVDAKAIIGNDRLYKKYKQCLVEKKPTGCPRDVRDLRKIIPEILDSLCKKCLPIHVEKFKEAAAYFCLKRRSEYEEVQRDYDPDGTIQKKFETKYGALDC